MPTITCNNYIVPLFEIDECLGDRKPASCVIDSSIYTELGLEADATQQQINQALYLSAIASKSITDGLQTQIDLTPSGDEGVISKTYAELIALISNNSLIVGKMYLLTDYMTTYTQPVTLTTKSSGVVEPLYLTALDVNKLSNIAYSKLYPQDIIYYEVTGDIGNEKGTEGFTKGKIYRRIDTQRNNDIGTDWRHVKYDREGVDKLLFEDYTGCINNTIKTYFLFNNTIGNTFYSNTIDNYFQNNTIGGQFYQNKISYDFSSNIIGDNFDLNVVGDYFIENTIGLGFIGNTVDNSFSTNVIGNYFEHNTIGYNFNFNIIGNNFGSNGVGNYFNNNSFSLLGIFNNIFENNISGKFLSLYTPSLAMQDLNISTIIFLLPNDIIKERYYDNTSTLIINTI